MKNIKKWLCTGMALIVLAGCAACGSNGDSAGGSGSTEADVQQSAPEGEEEQDQTAQTGQEDGSGSAVDPIGKYEEPVTISMTKVADNTVVFDESNPERKSMAENRWTNAYRDYLNVNLEYKWVVSDWESNTSKWAMAIAGHDLPDAGEVPDSVYQELLDGGLIMDMTELFEQYASEEYRSTLTESQIDQMMIDGRLMGLPYPNKGYHGSNLLFIRQDWLDKLGLPAPTTMAELEETARAFVDAKLGGEDTVGILFNQGMNGGDGKWQGFVNGYGAYIGLWLEKDGELVYSTIQPEMKDALLAMQRFYKEGLTNSDVAVANEEQISRYVANGKAGMWYGEGWSAVFGTLTLKQNNPEAVVASVYPPGPGEEQIRIQTDTPNVRRIFVSKDCEHPEAVVKMLNLTAKLDQEKYSEYSIDEDGFIWFKMLPFGDRMCAVTYDIDSSHTIAVAEETGNLDGIVGSYKDDYERVQRAKDPETFDPIYAWTYGINSSYEKLYDAYHKGLQLESAFKGLPTPTQKVKEDVLTDILSTAMIKVVMGEDISVFEQAVESWKSSGGDQITEEVNEWYRSNQN